CGVLFTHTLGKVSNIFHGSEVCEEQVELINAGSSVTVGEKLITHVGQNVKQQGVFQTLAGLQQAFHAKSDKAGIGDIGMSIKKFRFRSLADGVKPQQDILQKFCSVKLAATFIKTLVFFLNQRIQVGEDRVILGCQAVEFRAVTDAELGVQLLQYDFDGVDLPIGEVLVCPEKILKKGNMLTELA